MLTSLLSNVLNWRAFYLTIQTDTFYILELYKISLNTLALIT
jgi:hypothetical protein